MKRALQTEMNGGSFDCFALVADIVADPEQIHRERDRARELIANIDRATMMLPGMGKTTQLIAGNTGGK